MSSLDLTKERVKEIMEEARTRGLGFVEDDYFLIGGNEIYNPTVDNVGAEQWLLDIISK